MSLDPRIVKGGLVLVDPQSGAVLGTISLQYNPDRLTRSLKPAGAGGEREDALRLGTPPTETIRLEAEIDATDHLEFPDRHPATVRSGLHPQLAALEALLYPSAAALAAQDALAGGGSIEIVPAQGPLTLFVWSAHRIVPVRITDVDIVEEAFDPALNPIRAKVTLGMRVLTVNDLGHGHKGGAVYLAYLRAKESLRGDAPAATLSHLGLSGLP